MPTEYIVHLATDLAVDDLAHIVKGLPVIRPEGSRIAAPGIRDIEARPTTTLGASVAEDLHGFRATRAVVLTTDKREDAELAEDTAAHVFATLCRLLPADAGLSYNLVIPIARRTAHGLQLDTKASFWTEERRRIATGGVPPALGANERLDG